MAANVMTGFCRITVVAPDVRVDVALPEDVPLAELLPDVLRMADQWQNEGAHSGFALARLDGNELDTGLSLSAQGVRNGDLLYLRAATETLPPPVYDDVVDAIVQSVAEDSRMWGSVHFRRLGMAGGALWAGIAGTLKALTGAHEGVTTIMLNYVAYNLLSFLLIHGPLQAPNNTEISLPVGTNAQLPTLVPQDATLFGQPGGAYHASIGIFIALLAAGVFAFLMRRSALGYEIRAVGQSQRAARYAGIR